MAEFMVQKDSSNSDSEVGAFSPLRRGQNINQLPPEIIDRVLRLLDQNSLRQARLVSRKWNDLALNILSKTPGSVYFRFSDAYAEGINTKGLERVKKLQSILRLTQYHGMFFTELILTGGVPTVGTIELRNLLQEFGSNLKSLKLRFSNLPLPIFQQILENLCPNLEELDIQGPVVMKDRETIPLTLKLRKFKVQDPLFPFLCPNLIFSVVKSSPKLQVLHLDIIRQPDLWKKIQSFPEITKNLDEVKVRIMGGEMLLNDVSFSNKLTSLFLIIHHTTFPAEQLAGLLKNVGESLEKLTLHSFRLYHFLRGFHSYRKIELPLMKRLNKLQLCGYGEWFIDSIDCLESLPNLEILLLSHCDPYVKMDAVFLDASYFPMHPHKTLNTLFIKEFIKNPETVFAINRMFPNLRDLNLAISASVIPEPTESWFIQFFTGFAEMKNLKILDLTFYDAHKGDKINFEMCLSLLVALESLEGLKMSIDRVYTPYYPYPHHFPPSLEKVLIKIPNLKLLILKNFRLEIFESMRLFKTLGRNGILLKADENVLTDLSRSNF